jgi:hypothetical protein
MKLGAIHLDDDVSHYEVGHPAPKPTMHLVLNSASIEESGEYPLRS